MRSTREIDLLFSGCIDVTSPVPGASLTGSVGVDWDLSDAAPTLDADLDFERQPPARSKAASR